MHETRPVGLPAFTIVWFGQLVSLLGSAMSWFAFTIWAWQTTGEATALALVSFFSLGPTLLLSPLAGALVDRWNRKVVMMISDLATGAGTVIVLVLYAAGRLQIGHIYFVAVVAGSFQAFQFPAYSAAVTMMLPKKHYARAEGMLGLASAVSGILGPVLAAALLGTIGLEKILLIDIVTFLFAVGTLLLIHVPQPAASAAGQRVRRSLWQESLFGFRYVMQRPGLWGLQLISAAGNLFSALGYTLIAPMILARTAGDTVVLGSVQSAAAVGAAVGGVLLILWGGPRRRIHGALAGWALASLLGRVLFGLGTTLAAWSFFLFVSGVVAPLIAGSDQAIWQAKVAPDVQGRVFATKQLLAHGTVPIGTLLAGLLADHLFEPAMMPGGALAPTLGRLVGTGAGAGMALLLVLAGVIEMAIVLAGYAVPAIRDVETLLPDHAAGAEAPLPMGLGA
jgi:DHA3 family macrolide efflux protein-like MFS transporter